MNNLIRYYNQNRIKIWGIIISIIFIFILIKILNYFAKIDNNNKNNEVINSIKNDTVYNPNQSIISDEDVPEEKGKDFNKLIRSFLDYCNSEKPSEAYKLITDECKEELFPTQEYFENNYYNKIFKSNNTYDFQSWSTDDVYIYKVRVQDNPLSTRKNREYAIYRGLLYYKKRK